jgi:hypothetical protein
LANINKLTIAFEGIPACIVSKGALNYLGEYKDLPTQVVAFNNPKQKEKI